MNDLLTEADLDWVEAIVDIIERAAGKPWRAALDQLDDLQRATQPTSTRRFNAVVGAVQRITGGRKRNARAARRARGLVLGHPVFTPADRQARIDHAALMLGATSQSIETMLWSDLPRERPIELPSGRPSEIEAAAFANVTLLQRALRRAQSVSLTIVDDDPGPIVRAAAAHGLLATTLTEPDGLDDHRWGRAMPWPAHTEPPTVWRRAHRDGDVEPAALPAGREVPRGACVVEIAGPLAICHGTSVYGRALGELVPLLAEIRTWTLEIRVELPLASYTTHVTSPVLLPAPSARAVATPFPIMRIVRGVARIARSLRAVPTPPPLRARAQLLWPDLMIEDGKRRVFVELVGFWTREYLDRKVAAYRALGVEIILCVDMARASGSDELPREALAYTKAVPVDALVRRVRPS